MRILVCNDDGFDAPGLARLTEVARSLSDDVFVVAPDGKRTAGGTSITIARPLTMLRRGERRYSCSGTPADCVVTAMTWLFAEDRKPDLVLSGINDGRNVAEDVAYSGTNGIAREATFWGVPAIAFSRVKNAAEMPTDIEWLRAFIVLLWQNRAEWAHEGHWLNVNLPHSLPASIRQPRIGRDKIGRSCEVLEEEGEKTVLVIPRGREHATSPGDENALIDAGHVCVNRLNWFGETPLAEPFLAGLAALS
ncbi:5'/3'-nucleotidase SurE [Chelativorans sp. Marseille-P2723]|uniref:5'/3'-nucleotidase SurE n=1 Tax=Chelativorans sp. Marseille-P2723 TaxID=2709133 RepID=UPI00156DB5A7|nr:5'/3'-nucleotidase SurE [Chelativorans sp. Marseille-P2723]